MKININYKFIDSSYGGGNQFLKALKYELEKINIYTDNVNEASIVITNLSPESFNQMFFVLSRIIFSNKKIIGRIDGPIGLIRSGSNFYDKYFLRFSSYFFDGLIFQSEWSKRKLLHITPSYSRKSEVILNGSNTEIFGFKKKNFRNKKLNIVASSWSSHKNKGFEVYEWLDQNIDYSRFNFYFVGNSKYLFKNAKQLPPMESKDLANFYSGMDIYITASKNDPCSNSLIEAINCGLIPISLNDGGHPELNKHQKLLFVNKEEILGILDYVQKTYVNNDFLISHELSISHTSKKYLDFIKNVKKIRNKNIFCSMLLLIIFFMLLKCFRLKTIIYDKISSKKNTAQ